MTVRASRVRACTKPWQRMRGLIFTQPGPEVLVFPQCHDIHTHLMAYDIDVAFFDKTGQVLSSYCGVEPGCRIRKKGAWAVVERAASAKASWYRKGCYVDDCVLCAAQGKEG